jgi:metal iron transporter
VAGVAISIIDVLVVLVLYRPNKSLRSLRFFELAVSLLVFGVIICFAVELTRIPSSSAKEIFHGYLPSATIARGDGLYLSCGILGATVMPHSLYLGSGIVQPRVRDIDLRHGHPVPDADTPGEEKYLPSLAAIKQATKYSIIDLVISLTSCALFANSAILIVSASALYNTPAAQDADLFGIHDLLSKNIGKAAGLIFALALLFSGQSSGVVVTLAGQLVSEGFLNWTLRPWLRRLITRGVAITPCIVVAAAVGRPGLGAVLNASQVTLSILLPFVTAPLVWFTCRKGYMMCGEKDLKNGWVLTVLAVGTWGFITFLNM